MIVMGSLGIFEMHTLRVNHIEQVPRINVHK